MKDLTIPLPDFLEEQIAEVEVKINGKKRKYNFRVESFPWNIDSPTSEVEKSEIEQKIESLRENLEKYDDKFELVQIFSPKENSHHIQVLFRQKSEV